MIHFELFQNKKIAILWCGREGKSTLHFLLKIGVSPENITILDEAKQIEWLTSFLESIRDEFGIDYIFTMILGEKYLDNLKKYDLIIKTPGISLYHEKIYPYAKKIISQTQIFFDNYQGKVIAVSGTKGKSTTCTLIYELLKTAGKQVQLIGNIGKPMLDFLDIENPAWQQDEYAVCEISSYMLEGLKKKNYISVLLNIYPDHLDRHQGFENYQKAKFNILYGSEYVIIRHEILKLNEFEEEDFDEFNIRIFGQNGKYSYQNGDFFVEKKKVFNDQGILLQGEHNMMNVCAVLWICDIMDIDPKILKSTLEVFKGLPHRMENIWMYGGIVRVDDAISTTPESTIQALQTFGDEVDTIFLWWTDRGYDFKELAKTIVKSKIRNVVLFPESWERIYKEIKKYDLGEIKCFQATDMKQAVKFAYEYTKDRKICLLSTASPSYSLWKNFEEKGNLFQKYIKELV